MAVQDKLGSSLHSPADPADPVVARAPWRHDFVRTNGIRMHCVRQGSGRPLVLLHGWPEYWRVWRKVMPALAERFDVVAPDLRGFGDSDKPDLPASTGYSVECHVDDLLGLVDSLGFRTFGLVSHDVGAHVAQAFARLYPERLSGLFFFDCPNPGIGKRWGEPSFMLETWYQYLNQQPWAADFVGSSRKACELYLRHFFDHVAHRPGMFDDDIEAWVDTYLRDGNLQGGMNWYLAMQPTRLKMMLEGSPPMTKIMVPTCVRWGASDKILKPEFADRLAEYFHQPDVRIVEGAGHFVHFERPDYAIEEITRFFDRVAAA